MYNHSSLPFFLLIVQYTYVPIICTYIFKYVCWNMFNDEMGILLFYKIICPVNIWKGGKLFVIFFFSKKQKDLK